MQGEAPVFTDHRCPYVLLCQQVVRPERTPLMLLYGGLNLDPLIKSQLLTIELAVAQRWAFCLLTGKWAAETFPLPGDLNPEPLIRVSCSAN